VERNRHRSQGLDGAGDPDQGGARTSGTALAARPGHCGGDAANSGFGLCLPGSPRGAALGWGSNAGKVLVYCHAGCDLGGVLAALRSRGLWPNAGCRPLPPKVCQRSPVEEKAGRDRTEAALAIWRSANRAQGTLAEAYLASRAIRLPAPHGLRFHPGLKSGVRCRLVELMHRGSRREIQSRSPCPLEGLLSTYNC
jgi:hypothetical protein